MVSSTDYAFVAIRHDGTAVAWGDPDKGGQLSEKTRIELQSLMSLGQSP